LVLDPSTEVFVLKIFVVCALQIDVHDLCTMLVGEVADCLCSGAGMIASVGNANAAALAVVVVCAHCQIMTTDGKS